MPKNTIEHAKGVGSVNMVVQISKHSGCKVIRNWRCEKKRDEKHRGIWDKKTGVHVVMEGCSEQTQNGGAGIKNRVYTKKRKDAT